MIEISNLSVSFGDKKILNNIEMSFETGKIHAIFGLNGAGKTTFFNSLFGFINSNGNFQYNGKKLKRENIGFLETESFFYSFLTGKEYLDIFQCQEHLQIFDITKLVDLLNIPLHVFLDEYSTGMKKKIALLGIIKLSRDIYILDEPFNGLDVESVFLLKSILTQLRNKGKTIFISSHVLETLLDISDNFHVLESGKIVRFNDSKQFEIYCNSVYARINTQVKNTIL